MVATGAAFAVSGRVIIVRIDINLISRSVIAHARLLQITTRYKPLLAAIVDSAPGATATVDKHPHTFRHDIDHGIAGARPGAQIDIRRRKAAPFRLRGGSGQRKADEGKKKGENTHVELLVESRRTKAQEQDYCEAPEPGLNVSFIEIADVRTPLSLMRGRSSLSAGG